MILVLSLMMEKESFRVVDATSLAEYVCIGIGGHCDNVSPSNLGCAMLFNGLVYLRVHSQTFERLEEKSGTLIPFRYPSTWKCIIHPSCFSNFKVFQIIQCRSESKLGLKVYEGGVECWLGQNYLFFQLG